MKKLISVLLMLALVFGLAGCSDEDSDPTTAPTTFVPVPVGPVYDRENYTVALDALQADYGTIVAELGEQQVDVELLQIAYWSEFVGFLYQNSNNLAAYGLDLSLPLHEQANPGYGGNWQQFFMNQALKSLHNHLAMVHAAQCNGVTMPAGLQKDVDSGITEMEKAAEESGYTDMDAYVTYIYGPGCTLKALRTYNYLAMCAAYYQDYCISQMEITDQMVDDYYEAHKEDFINAGMIQDDRIVYRVRHIMVMVDEGSDDTVWEAARVKAQGYLDQYLAGEQTEEAFANLALEYSDDNETYRGGGLVDGLVPNSLYPEAFKNWYLDSSRQVADVELIKTELGYHVMFYKGIQPAWRYEATMSMTNTMIGTILPDTVAQYPITVYYDKLMVAEATDEEEK